MVFPISVCINGEPGYCALKFIPDAVAAFVKALSKVYIAIALYFYMYQEPKVLTVFMPRLDEFIRVAFETRVIG
jgi:hypothetical protein